MGRQVIRSLEDSTESKLELVIEDLDIFWIKDGKRIRDQKEHFKRYNPLLNERLAKLKAYKGESIKQSELVTLLELDRSQITYYFNKLKPNLHSEKRKPIPLKNIYEMLEDFMPVIEKWQKSKEIADKNKISQTIVRNYCRGNLVENKSFLHTYWVSPLGLTRLKELLHIEYSLAREWGTTAEVATRLGVSQSVVSLYCRKKKISSQRYLRGFRISHDQANLLRNNIRGGGRFEFAGGTYYPLSDVAKQAVNARRITDPEAEEKFLKRFYYLREACPESFPSLVKRKVRSVTEGAKDLLIDLMTQAEACKELGISKYEVRKSMRMGILDKELIGPTNWTTYSSVMKQRQQMALKLE